MDVLVDRVAGLDVHKRQVTAGVRTPGEKRRVEEVREFSTYTEGLRQLRGWLEAEDVSVVAMEATGVYWRPIWHALDGMAGVELLLVNARHVKNVPGRKTDVADASWLAQLAECGLLRGSFVPPPLIAHLRDLTRYRTKIVAERAREIQRIQKLLEDAGIKLSSLASDVTGVSSRRMLEALIAGERDPAVLADMALTRMRPKIPELVKALEGPFGDHHAVMCRMHLDHIDHLSGVVDRLDAEIATVIRPFDSQLAHLQTIPGVGRRVAEVVVAEIGVDMTRFPSAGHLSSWAGLCPGNNESAGKRKSTRATDGDGPLRTALCEAAWAAVHTRDTYMAAQYSRFLRRFGRRNETKAIFAVAHTILVAVYHMLSRGEDYHDLGADYFDRRADPERQIRRLVAQLQALGQTVTVTPAA
jgi:transposase